MKSFKFEAKNLDEAKKIAITELRVNQDFIEVKVLEKKGIISKTLICEATTTVEPTELGYNLLKDMFVNMGIEASIEMKRRNEKEVLYTINTEENPLLIGKAGKTLENIQFYVRNIVNLYSAEKIIVLVDIGGYKDNRKKQLEIIATKTAKDVARSRIEAKLEPMNAYERRIIHTKLSDWRDVSTTSEGENPNRYIVIKPRRR